MLDELVVEGFVSVGPFIVKEEGADGGDLSEWVLGRRVSMVCGIDVALICPVLANAI